MLYLIKYKWLKKGRKSEGTGPKNGYLFLISEEELCRLYSKEKFTTTAGRFQKCFASLFVNQFLTPLVLLPLFLKLSLEKSGIFQ